MVLGGSRTSPHEILTVASHEYFLVNYARLFDIIATFL